MSLEAYKAWSSEPETFLEIAKITGNSTSTPTITYGKGFTISRSGVGVWQITFADYPGTFIGFSCEFQATTSSGVKGFTATLGDFDSTGKIVSISLWDSTFAAVDLSTTQKACLMFFFRRASV